MAENKSNENSPNKDLVDYAVNYWANFLSHSVVPDSINKFPLEAVDTAIELADHYSSKTYPQKNIDQFKANLAENLTKRLNMPHGRAGLSTDYEPEGALYDTLHYAGINPLQVGFPERTIMSVDANEGFVEVDKKVVYSREQDQKQSVDTPTQTVADNEMPARRPPRKHK